MKLTVSVLTLGVLASANPITRQASSQYEITDFYAGSGPKSSITNYNFGIAIVRPDGAVANEARCSTSSGSNWHNGYITPVFSGTCDDEAAGYGFSFTSTRTPDQGYWLNITDEVDGSHAGSKFYSQSLVKRVQNNANPTDPDPFPNYELREAGTSQTPRTAA
ncbi:hypothetical protein K4K51_010204 [Colletotrichum sp. SAR 10_75]|nr:hypothetical protein K4K51_010204 [Colletotrichum sp. SAR 10_75]